MTALGNIIGSYSSPEGYKIEFFEQEGEARGLYSKTSSYPVGSSTYQLQKGAEQKLPLTRVISELISKGYIPLILNGKVEWILDDSKSEKSEKKEAPEASKKAASDYTVLFSNSNISSPKNVLCEWSIDHHKIFLTKKRKKLLVVVQNTLNNKQFEQFIEVENCDLDKLAEHLINQYYPVVGSSDVEFAKVLKQWPALTNKVVSILKTPEDIFVWQISDYDTHSSSQFFTFWPSPFIYSRSENIIVKAICRANIAEKMYQNLDFLELPFYIRKKITYPSRFDPSVMVNGERWAVTLLSIGRSYNGHAALGIEGINEKGQAFYNLAHITAAPEALIKACNKTILYNHFKSVIAHVELKDGYNNYSIKRKSQTWLRKKEVVRRVMDIVRLESDQLKKGTPKVFFQMVAPYIGSTPIKAYTYESPSEFVDANFDIMKYLAPFGGPFFNKYKGGGSEFWLGYTRSMSIKYHICDDNQEGPVDLYISPDNCLSYALRTLRYANIIIDYGFFRGASCPDNIEETDALSEAAIENVQERCVVPFMIKSLNMAFRIDFTEVIQKAVGNKPWKLAEETVDLLDKWTWFPEIGTGYASLRKLKVREASKNLDNNEPNFTCHDFSRVEGGIEEVTDLVFTNFSAESFNSLINIEDIDKELVIPKIWVEVEKVTKAVDIRDECARQFQRLDADKIKSIVNENIKRMEKSTRCALS